MLERSRHLLTAIGMATVAAVVAGCTAQPLYSTSVAPAAGNNTSVTAALGQVNVAPVTTREAQEVRNELIFLLSGGGGNPVDAPYELTLSAYASSQSSTAVNTVGIEQAPTAAIMSFVGTYTLTESGTGRVVGKGTRHATALYDVPINRPFAEQRSARDAQDRSARELAALLAAAIAADLATGRKAAAP
jgi:LPS-assembly lipoprotein